MSIPTFGPLRRRLAGLAATAALSLAALAPAQAAFVYSLDVRSTSGLGGAGDLQFTVDTLLTGTVDLLLTDLDFIFTPPAGTTSIRFTGIDSAPLLSWEGSGLGLFWTSANAFTGPGVYCTGFVPCDQSAAVMTITEVTTGVPEPATSALVLAALLAGAAAARRRA